jgi:hypothetical protein
VRASTSTTKSGAVTTYLPVVGPKDIVRTMVTYHIESLPIDTFNPPGLDEFQGLINHYFKGQGVSQHIINLSFLIVVLFTRERFDDLVNKSLIFSAG